MAERYYATKYCFSALHLPCRQSLRRAGISTIHFATAFPTAWSAPNAFTAGQIKPGETLVFYFNVTVNESLDPGNFEEF